MRRAAAILLVLAVAAFGATLLARTGSAVDVGLDEPLTVQRLLPGPSEAWACLAALGLAVAALATTRRAGLLAASVLGGTLLVGGVAVWWAAGSASADLGTAAVGCRDGAQVRGTSQRSMASGTLDGVTLGHVEVHPQARPTDVLVVTHDTRWGRAIALLPVPPVPGDDPLEALTLRRDARLTADDLGVDVVDGLVARHCQLVVDGHAAVLGFPALRWLVGEDAHTTDPGAGLESWRGTVDYWLVRTMAMRFESEDVVLATVSVDGQPPHWPFPGLRATLHAATWFGGP